MHGSPAQNPAPDHLAWLHAWYSAHCNGTWEHTAGLTLHPLAARGRCAAGWQLIVELAGTSSEVPAPRTFSLTSFDGGWMSCSLTAERFHAEGDTARLEQMIGVFRGWIEKAEDQTPASAPLRLLLAGK